MSFDQKTPINPDQAYFNRQPAFSIRQRASNFSQGSVRAMTKNPYEIPAQIREDRRVLKKVTPDK